MAFADPKTILEEFGVQPGSVVADIGSGTGYYTVLLSELVGEGGTVFAVEIQPELLTKSKSLGGNHLDNIEHINGDVEVAGGTQVRDGQLDAAIMSNILFQLTDKAAGLTEVFRILKPGGRLLVIDWSDSFGGLGPQPEHITSEETARQLLESAGFSFEKTLQSSGDHHYGLIFNKP